MTYLRFAIIILTATDVRFKFLNWITNAVWQKFGSTPLIRFPKQQMSVLADDRLYEVASVLIPTTGPDGEVYPANESVVQLNKSTLNKEFRELYLQINYDEQQKRSLGLNSLRRINKQALYEMLTIEGPKAVDQLLAGPQLNEIVVDQPLVSGGPQVNEIQLVDRPLVSGGPQLNEIKFESTD